MLILPQIKKELKNFFFDETGSITKQNILRMGIIGAIAALGASNVNAGNVQGGKGCVFSSSLTNIPSDYVLLDANSTRSYWFSPLCDEGTDDNCDVVCGLTQGDKSTYESRECDPAWFASKGLDYIKVGADEHQNSGDDEWVTGKIVFDDVLFHQNNLVLSPGAAGELSAQHDHAVVPCSQIPGCSDANDVDFHVYAMDDESGGGPNGDLCGGTEVITWCQSVKLGIDPYDPLYHHCSG